MTQDVDPWMITSDADCSRALLLVSIFFEKMGLSDVSNDVGRLAAFMDVRCSAGQSDIPATSAKGSGSFAQNVVSVHASLTINPRGCPQRPKTRREAWDKMGNHEWMDDVLRDIIAYATLNDMPQVARHVALGLDALHLHVYEEERRATRLLVAMRAFESQVAGLLDWPAANKPPLCSEVPFAGHSAMKSLQKDWLIKQIALGG